MRATIYFDKETYGQIKHLFDLSHDSKLSHKFYIDMGQDYSSSMKIIFEDEEFFDLIVSILRESKIVPKQVDWPDGNSSYNLI